MNPTALLPLTFLLLALASSAAAQDQPTFIDPMTNLTVNANETACLAKLNWPKCFGWNFRNVTIKDDPNYEKMEAQICTPECVQMKFSLSREYIEAKCGPNPILPRRIRLDRIELSRIRSQFVCTKDETGKRSCLALGTETFEEAKFNASEHMGPDGNDVIPWKVIPRDYACSKCILEDIEVEKQTDEWYQKNWNVTDSFAYYDRSEKGMQERAELCKGWKPSAIKNSPSPAVGATSPSNPPSSASSLILGSTMVMLAGVVVAIVAV